MTIATPETIMGRIKSATRLSPIAVFKTPEGQLNSMFAGTVKNQRKIKTEKDNLVGVFDSSMDPRKVLFQLIEAEEVGKTA